MKDMDKAVQRIETALENDERILVFGDYEVIDNSDIVGGYEGRVKRRR